MIFKFPYRISTQFSILAIESLQLLDGFPAEHFPLVYHNSLLVYNSCVELRALQAVQSDLKIFTMFELSFNISVKLK